MRGDWRSARLVPLGRRTRTAVAMWVRPAVAIWVRLLGVGSVVSVGFSVGLGVGLGAGSAAAAPAQQTPGISVSLAVVGTPPAGAPAQFDINLACRTPGGTLVGQRLVTLTAGAAARAIGTAEMPGLTTADRCTATASAEGAQTTYATSQPDRSDGSTPDPMGGVIDGNTYRSAPAQANGQSIAVTHRYTGDLLLAKVVTGAPETTMGTYQLQVTCADAGFLQTLTLSNGQTRVLTGIPVGSVCRVTEPSTPAARFDDTSGDPHDGVVTIVATTAACWDLRNATPACRVSVTSTHAYSVADQQLDGSLNTVPQSQTTTTVPDTQQQAATTAAPAAPAPVEEPAMLDSTEQAVGDIAYTGPVVDGTTAATMAVLALLMIVAGIGLITLSHDQNEGPTLPIWDR